MIDFLEQITEMLDIDFITTIVNFIKSLYSFFDSLIDYSLIFTSWISTFNPIIATSLLLAIFAGIFFAMLKIVKLIPGL